MGKKFDHIIVNKERKVMSKRVIGIGDCHGCLSSLKLLIESVIKPTQDDIITFVGDAIDRGPQIPQVIDYLINLKKEFPNTKFCLGNHDQMFIKYLKHEQRLDDYQTFLYNGGKETINQYDDYLCRQRGHKFLSFEELPQSHQDFFNSLEPIIVDQEHEVVFVHAGLRPGVSIIEQNTHDLLWIRDTFLHSDCKWGDFKIVHGHTPMTLNESKIYNRKHPERFNVDNGCVFGYNLTGVDVLTGDIYTVNCEDTESLYNHKK